ncbi:MAG: glycerophosphodiester phosphodiesterase [Sporichthyaceae bacterium]
MRQQIAAAPMIALALAAAFGVAGPARPVMAAAPPVDTVPVTKTVPQLQRSPAIEAIAGKNADNAREPRLEIGGHRGGLDSAPENTLAAIRKAVELGADSVEVDVRYTADGKPVILHDDTLERTTNCSGHVANWKLTALLRCDAGTWFNQAFSDERVPTLEEVLDELDTTGLKLYLHVKLVENLTQAAALVTAVAASDMDGANVVFVADEHSRLEMLALAGVPMERLAWVVHHAKDFAPHLPRYGALVAHCPKLTRAQVERIQARGQRVLAVEGFPITRAQASQLKLDGILADNLKAALAYRN